MSYRNTGRQASANYKEVTVGTGVICRIGSQPGFQQMPHSVHDLCRRRLAGGHVPPCTPKIKSSRPCYSPLASSTTQRQYLLLQDLQCDLLNRELSPVPSVSSRLRSTSTCTEVERLTERRADEACFFSAPLLSQAEGGVRERKRKREKTHRE